MDEWLPEPQEQGWLEPPRRRPPTAVGVATPPPPRGPERHYETRMERIGRLFTQLAFATALGLTASNFVPVPVLVSWLVLLLGGRAILQRQDTHFSRLVLNLGSSSSPHGV